MKGAYSFTICGDPLFFAPELVNHQGYDYAADLWALGILAFEIYEESTPFGNSDTDETTIFKKISAYKGELPFTEKTPKEARALVQSWLNPTAQLRAGYLMDNVVKDNALFSGEAEVFHSVT
jgi:cGMP-dependent protein kinase